LLTCLSRNGVLNIFSEHFSFFLKYEVNRINFLSGIWLLSYMYEDLNRVTFCVEDTKRILFRFSWNMKYMFTQHIFYEPGRRVKICGNLSCWVKIYTIFHEKRNNNIFISLLSKKNGYEPPCLLNLYSAQYNIIYRCIFFCTRYLALHCDVT
jgi:hypothetical protein